MTLRITGGELRGQKVKFVSLSHLRPTISAMREAVFNICQQEIEGAKFLDLFAGSGIMGIEALSRGASSAYFIEQNRQAGQMIRKNLERLGLIERASILCGDVFTVLYKVKMQFNLIYIDPPYHDLAESKISDLFDLIFKHSLLADEGTIFLESHFIPNSSFEFSSFKLIDSRRFASSSLHRYRLQKKN